jgi:membrane-bound lytic murein transglycosylase MltF
MNLLKPKYLRYVVLGLISALVVTFWPRKEKPQGHPRDYAEIEESGILHAATEYNSISFYVDGDTVSGFHYELIEAFARDKACKYRSPR